MAVFVAIHLPRLSLEVFRPRWSPRTENGCVVLDQDKVAIADAVARDAGVVIGMKRGGVLTLAPDALVYDREPAREQDVLREVALALMRFSPMVAVCEEETVVIDVSASLRLFGGILRICHQMREVVDAMGVTVRMSVAPTGQGAWMLAKCDQGQPTPRAQDALARARAGRAFVSVSCRKSARSPTGSPGSGAECSKISVACRAPV